jgi:hypothetical protein
MPSNSTECAGSVLLWRLVAPFTRGIMPAIAPALRTNRTSRGNTGANRLLSASDVWQASESAACRIPVSVPTSMRGLDLSFGGGDGLVIKED